MGNDYELSSEHSFGYDLVVGNNSGESLNPYELMIKHEWLLTRVRKTIIYEGASVERRGIWMGDVKRQSKAFDDASAQAFQGTSCFSYYPKLATLMQASFRSFLLVDAMHALPEGEAFECATDPNYSNEHADYALSFEHANMLLLYTQMHLASLKNPTGSVLFHFYGSGKEEMSELYMFLRDYQTLLPPKLTLKLYNYKPTSSLDIYKELSGSGVSLGIDENYNQTIRLIKKHLESSPDATLDDLAEVIINSRTPRLVRLDTIWEDEREDQDEEQDALCVDTHGLFAT